MAEALAPLGPSEVAFKPGAHLCRAVPFCVTEYVGSLAIQYADHGDDSEVGEGTGLWRGEFARQRSG